MPGQVLFGSAGWSYPDWAGIVYPRPRPPSFDPLVYLADYLQLLEINASFYQPLDERLTAQWLRRLPASSALRFTVKGWRRMTHLRQGITEDDHHRQIKGWLPLYKEGRALGLLFQFPGSFVATPENRVYLTSLLERYRPFSPFVEFRHVSWMGEETRAGLLRVGAGLVVPDLPPYRQAYRPGVELAGDIAYFRFHGRNLPRWLDPHAGRDQRYDYLYSEKEVSELATTVERLSAKSKQVIVVGNNHFHGQALVNLLQIKQRLFRERISVPAPLLTRYPVLRQITSNPIAQQDFFINNAPLQKR